MKHSKIVFLVFGAALLFLGCEKMDPLVPGSGNDLESNALKAAVVKTAFNGICTPTAPPNPGDNAWYDDADDERVKGISVWVIEEVIPIDETTFELKGTCELTLDDGLGKWSTTWQGCQTLTSPDGSTFKIVVHAVGTGTEGIVTGMTGKWKYTLDFDGTPETFVYIFKGKISEEG